MSSKFPSVAEWFRGRGVFITGGTGFMGKVLIYKLLSSCQDIGNVFLLIREKKDIDPSSRIQKLMEEEPFKILKEKNPEALKKIIVIPGNTVTEGLNLSASDAERILREVSVVFHMAANVRFDLHIRDAININTRGTRNVLNFVKQIPGLVSFIHVSTAFSQCNETVLEERSYPPVMDPDQLIKIVNETTLEELRVMTPKFLDNQPNTYAFSKALTEDLVRRCGLPTGIARPSIVTASWKEPVEGWVDNINGATGLMIGAGKGVIRTFLCNSNYLLDIIPCDMAVNAVIALAWKVGNEKPTKPIYINVTTNRENIITWEDAIETGRKHTIANPFTGILWYPGGSATSSKVFHYTRLVLFQFLPALILDIILTLIGQKPFLIKVQQKVCNAYELLQYYTMKQWHFENDNLKRLQKELSPTDRETFYMDTKVICWNEYILSYILGTRKYFLKDDPSTLPRARKVMRTLYFADMFVKIVFVLFVVWIIYYWLISSREWTTTVIEPNNI